MSGDEPLSELVAIILLTKNGATYLRSSLDSVFAQGSRYSFEVLVVDSGSTDGTLDIVETRPARVFRIPPDDFQHGRTRNLAASLVSPDVEYLIYLSQDATPLPGWLDALVDAVATGNGVAGAFSRHIPRPDCNPLLARRMLEEWEQIGGQTRLVKKLHGAVDLEERGHALAHFSNTSSCLRRSVWQRIPFPEADFAEDVAWAVEVLEAGYELVYEPASQVLHSHSGSLSRLLRENVDAGRGLRAALRKWTFRFMPPRHSAPERVSRDLRYVWQCNIPVVERLRWTLYTPVWYLAAMTGLWIGTCVDRAPAWLREHLSWQAAVEHDS